VAKPKRMEMAAWRLQFYEHSGLRRLVYTLGINSLFTGKLRAMEAMLPHLPQRALRRRLPRVSPARGGERYRIGFFLGCAQSLLFADESLASLRVLTRNGCTVISPSEILCCGMPAAGYGRIDLLLEQARTNIALYEKENLGWIVTDCATCGSTLKEYGRLLADDPAWAERASAFSSKVRDVSEFLMTIPLEKPTNRIDGRVTYHDPCHLRRAQSVWKQPRELLKKIPGLEFTELPEADWCCGSAGSQIITHFETSQKVLKRKTDNLATTGADFVASGCPACQLQLTAGVKQAGLSMEVVHPITLLDRAYGNLEAADG
jgi:glycolate oxidase iron-sulfur subunit